MAARGEPGADAGTGHPEARLRAWVQAVADGRLSRRGFVARAAALGIGAPMVGLMLADAGVAQTAGGAPGASAATPAGFAYAPTRRGGGGTLRLLLWQGPTLLNPHFATGSKDEEATRIFYEPLASWDAEGNLVPILAAELPSRANGGLAADGRSVTWRLKRGVQWHDGQPFTADDVVFNWRYADDPATAAVTLGTWQGVRAVEKVDSHTVRVVWERPTPFWPGSFCSVPLIPRHLFAAFTGAKSREAPANLRPVGTGPYRFVDFRPGDSLRGELNPDYHLPNRPHFDRIEVKGGGDAVSAARAVLQAGEFDYAWNLQVEDEVLRRLEAGGKGRVAIVPGGAIEHIQLQEADPWAETEGERAHPKSRHPVLRDPAVREALALLVDRASIQQAIYGRTGIATANYLNNPERYRSPNQRMAFSVEQAAARLEAAGWTRGRSGVREKDGRPLKLLFQTGTNAPRQKVQAVFKQACARAGIELELKSVTPSVFFSSDVANPDTYGKFWADLQMYTQSQGRPDPERLMQVFVSSEAASRENKWLGRNRGRWISPEYDRLYAAAEGELDPVKRAALFVQMNDLVCGSRHVIPLLVRPLVAGLALNLRAPLSGWANDVSFLHDWHRVAA
jgi:peptide/nickel transport system substrate-binding protein